MKKRKLYRNLLILVITLCLVVGTTVQVSAAETQEDNIVVSLEIVKIPTEYSKEDFRVVYEFGDESNRAIIYENLTGMIVEEYVEVIHQSSRIARDTGGYRTVDIYDYFYPNNEQHSSTRMRAIANVVVYRETITGQVVNSIISTNSFKTELVDSGPYTLESSSTTENHHTLNYCDVNCIGVLQTTSQEATRAGFDAEFLKSIGFSVSTTSSTNWIARLPYSKVIRITA